MPVTIKAYTFKELRTKEAKEAARKWMRDYNNEDSFHAECITEQMQELLKEEGFPDDVRWNLWTQGSGVSFKGTIDLLKYTDFHKLREWGPVEEFYGVRLTWNDHHYTHWRTMGMEIEEYDPQDHPQAFWVTQHRDALEAHIKSRIQEISHDLEQMAEKEYEYYDSEEYIDEMLVSNDYLFTKDGRRMPL